MDTETLGYALIEFMEADVDDDEHPRDMPSQVNRNKQMIFFIFFSLYFELNIYF